MNNIKSFIFNKDYYREVFIAITILFAIAFFTPFSSILNLFLLAWGGILILNDLLTKRAMFKSKKSIPLICFMIFYGITIVINRDLNLFENIKIFALTILQFFILFIFDKDKSTEELHDSLKRFNNIIIKITFVASTISLVVYLLGINFQINNHNIGVEGGSMLTGIYTSANTAGPLAIISIIATLLNNKILGEKKFSKYHLSNIIVQLIFIYMTNSRASLYCILAFAVIFAIFNFDSVKEKAIGLVGVGVIYFLSKIVNEILYWIYKGIDFVIMIVKYLFEEAKYYLLNLLGYSFDKVDKGSLDLTGGSTASEAIEKEISMGFLNGRAQLWECGFNIFKDNFLFGVGSRNVSDVALTYASYSDLPGVIGGGMHNIIIQVLVSNGILGFLSLFVFIVMCLITFIKFFAKVKLKNKNSKIVLVIVATLITLLINNMAEANILYSASYMATVFWTYLGFGIVLSEKYLSGEVL